jgi:hypothetical protein
MRFELIGVKDDVCRRNPGQVVFYGEMPFARFGGTLEVGHVSFLSST